MDLQILNLTDTFFMNGKSDINKNFKPGINKLNINIVDSRLRDLNRASR